MIAPTHMETYSSRAPSQNKLMPIQTKTAIKNQVPGVMRGSIPIMPSNFTLFDHSNATFARINL
jgi:hypothetical protein